jgi:tetratricopeptide (TPR) repeat protein
VSSHNKPQHSSTPSEKPSKGVSETVAVSRFAITFVVASLFTIGITAISYGLTRYFAPTPAPPEPQQQASAEQEIPKVPPIVLKKIDSLQALYEQSPDNNELTLALANAYYDGQMFIRSSKLYSEYLKSDSTNSDVLVDYAFTLLQQGDMDGAFTYTTKALEHQPHHAIAMFNLGILYFQAQDYEKATEWLEKCRKIEPEGPIAPRVEQVLAEIQKRQKT